MKNIKEKFFAMICGIMCVMLFTTSLWDGIAVSVGNIPVFVRVVFDAGIYLTFMICFLLLCDFKKSAHGSILFYALFVLSVLFANFSGANPVMRILFAIILGVILWLSIRSENINALESYDTEDNNSYYQNIEERYMRSRELWHDMRNHLAVLNGYISSGDYEGMRKYTAEFCDELERIIIPFRTGNMVADTILGDKIYLAHKHMIQTDIDIAPLKSLSMSGADLCTVLGNLLDNAIEACLCVDEKDRYIKIKFRWNDDTCFLSVENSCIQSETDHSTKLNKEFHGIGLRSVERVVHKYGGSFIIIPHNNIFKAVAELR